MQMLVGRKAICHVMTTVDLHCLLWLQAAAPHEPGLRRWLECWPAFSRLTRDYHWLEADAVLQRACRATGLSCSAVAAALPAVAKALESHIDTINDVACFRRELDSLEGYSKNSSEPLQVSG